MSQAIKIQAIIDTVCPWCFIGKRRLDKAIEKFKTVHSNVSIQVNYLPYELDSERKTVNKKESYIKKFGETRFNSMLPMITETAAGEGIDLKFGGVISNTFDSHRLIWWSNQFGKQADLVEEICKLYFERNEDLADHETLSNAAERAGLVKKQALDFIKSNEGISEVRSLLRQNVYYNVNGVPHYIINDKYSVSGAQEPDTLVEVFEQILSKEQ
ncbi:hypothetical protein G6F37_000348 [Rhizopus arrhizus]|nr:hypothetical protein G6F38_000454 [Rhizopus arrhizus]KAG1164361.1 hypothetical protein G6F37_000348 [Rhizopus arrhizus]